MALCASVSGPPAFWEQNATKCCKYFSFFLLMIVFLFPLFLSGVIGNRTEQNGTESIKSAKAHQVRAAVRQKERHERKSESNPGESSRGRVAI
jgi:hypothetical protein